MKDIANTMASVGLALGLAVSAQGDIILVDLGNDDSYRGASVTSPDANGNHWNSVRAGAFFADLVDINGDATTVDFGFTIAGGSDFFNGPSGSVEDPAAVVIDAGALGNLGINEAVYDWYSSSTFQIQQLDPTKTYNLTLFGSRKFPFGGDTVTVYTAYTDDTYSTPIASVSLAIGDGVSGHNQDQVAVLSGLVPQGVNNVLYIGFDGATGESGYLNAFQLSVIPEPGTVSLIGLGLALLAVRTKRRQRA